MARRLSGSLIFATRLKDKDDKDFRMSHAGNMSLFDRAFFYVRVIKASSKRDS